MSNSDMMCKPDCKCEKCRDTREENARDKVLKEAKCGEPLMWIKSACCRVGVQKWLIGFECTKCKRKDVKVLIK